MTFKKCRNDGCEVLIEVRNVAGEGWRPFEESGSKHNCQFSDYAKKQRGESPMREKKPSTWTEVVDQAEEKDDHGNELVRESSKSWQHMNVLGDTEAAKNDSAYVDHTQGQKLKLKTITDPTPEGVDLKYNRLADEQKIRYSQSHVEGSQYTVYVWYEEVK